MLYTPWGSRRTPRATTSNTASRAWAVALAAAAKLTATSRQEGEGEGEGLAWTPLLAP